MRTDGMRPLVEAVGHEVARLSANGDGGAAALERHWGALVEFLALGPAPELRECPRCGVSGMRAATRCGSCWAVIEPLPPLGAGAGPA